MPNSNSMLRGAVTADLLTIRLDGVSQAGVAIQKRGNRWGNKWGVTP